MCETLHYFHHRWVSRSCEFAGYPLSISAFEVLNEPKVGAEVCEALSMVYSAGVGLEFERTLRLCSAEAPQCLSVPCRLGPSRFRSGTLSRCTMGPTSSYRRRNLSVWYLVAVPSTTFVPRVSKQTSYESLESLSRLAVKHWLWDHGTRVVT
jgi:hypothetical protein